MQKLPKSNFWDTYFKVIFQIFFEISHIKDQSQSSTCACYFLTSSALIVSFSPSLRQRAYWGTMFLNDSIIFEDLDSWQYEKIPVMTTTAVKTIPRYKLSSGGCSIVVAWMKQATKHKTAPSHRSMANPPKRFFRNLIHSVSKFHRHFTASFCQFPIVKKNTN